jgi:ribosomal protein L32E
MWKYVHSIEYNRAIKAFHKQERDLMAACYRRARRENPEIARIMFRRAQSVRAQLVRGLAASLFSNVAGIELIAAIGQGDSG